MLDVLLGILQPREFVSSACAMDKQDIVLFKQYSI